MRENIDNVGTVTIQRDMYQPNHRVCHQCAECAVYRLIRVVHCSSRVVVLYSLSMVKYSRPVNYFLYKTNNTIVQQHLVINLNIFK